MSEIRILKRKIYDRMLKWKQERDGKTALLVKGARRVGKSTIVEEFALQEYETYMLIDFSRASEEVKSLFNDLMDLTIFSCVCRLSIMSFFKYAVRSSSSMKFRNALLQDRQSSSLLKTTAMTI